MDKKKILVIDDVTMNLMTIKSHLSELYDVRVAKSGEIALSVLGSVKIDLILLDIEMPGMSGFDFINIMREKPDVADTPIIFVTSHNTANVVNRAYKAGVVDYIVKPVNAEILLSKIAAVLDSPEDRFVL
jgi:CheY-like chemotaxis protein